jgi:hypothetical protein
MEHKLQCLKRLRTVQGQLHYAAPHDKPVSELNRKYETEFLTLYLMLLEQLQQHLADCRNMKRLQDTVQVFQLALTPVSDRHFEGARLWDESVLTFCEAA